MLDDPLIYRAPATPPITLFSAAIILLLLFLIPLHPSSLSLSLNRFTMDAAATSLGQEEDGEVTTETWTLGHGNNRMLLETFFTDPRAQDVQERMALIVFHISRLGVETEHWSFRSTPGSFHYPESTWDDVSSLFLPDRALAESWTEEISLFASMAAQVALRCGSELFGVVAHVDLEGEEAKEMDQDYLGYGTGEEAEGMNQEPVVRVDDGLGCSSGGEERVGEVTCAICLENFDPSTGFWSRCCHVFHWHCIDQWLQLSLRCPTCRTELPPDEEDDQEADNVGSCCQALV